jgi:hypothetical protein
VVTVIERIRIGVPICFLAMPASCSRMGDKPPWWPEGERDGRGVEGTHTASASPSPYEFRDPACSHEHNDTSEARFERPAAQEALERIAPSARTCEDDEFQGSWSVEMMWGPDGCVLYAMVVGERLEPSVGSCIANWYRQVAIRRFGGSGASAFVSDRGATFEFSRVGKLEASVIQAVVRAEYNRLRACYQDGLSRDPRLRGRVSARFTIRESGVVARVRNAGSDLPDATVVSCVLSVFTTLRFPKPVGGTVAVVYPVMLEPG